MKLLVSQVLVRAEFNWISSRHGQVPPGAVEAGRTVNGEALYVGRVMINATGTHQRVPAVGKVQRSCWGHIFWKFNISSEVFSKSWFSATRRFDRSKICQNNVSQIILLFLCFCKNLINLNAFSGPAQPRLSIRPLQRRRTPLQGIRSTRSVLTLATGPSLIMSTGALERRRTILGAIRSTTLDWSNLLFCHQHPLAKANVGNLNGFS